MSWQVLAFLAACLTPLSYIPTLWRMAKLRTADGITLQLGLLGIVSYSAWLALASGVALAMYLTLVVAAFLASVQFVLVQRYTGAPRRALLHAAALGATAFIVALRAPWVAALVIVPIDVSWFVRAIRDVLRSDAAHAVSPWAWTLTFCAYLAWTVEAWSKDDTVLFLQCLVLCIGAVAAWAATVWMHRRHAG